MVAVALTLSIGVLKFLNFSIPGLFMIGGMTTWALVRAGMPWPLAVGGALAAGAAASLLVERFTWRWMRMAEHFVPLVSSMAFLLLFEHLAVVYWGSELRTLPALFSDADLRFAGLVISIPQLLGLIASIALIWALTVLLARTRVGRGLRTIAEDSDTALLLGVNINRVVPVVFVVSGLFAALAGVIFALNYRQVQPFMGQRLHPPRSSLRSGPGNARMARRTTTYAIRLAVEGGGQVKAELVSVGQSGEQSLKRIESRGRARFRRAEGPRPSGGAAAHRHSHARRRARSAPRRSVVSARLIDRSISAADAIGKTADKIGVGVEALQELRFAAKASGVEQQTLYMALQRFTRRAAEAAQGTGEAKDALAQMGIALRDQSGNLRRSEDLLADVADAFARIEDPAERVRLAFKLFDSEGVALVNLLRGGSGALEDMRERARDLGIVLDEHLVRDAERARTELDTLSQVISANLTRAALEAAPVIADLSSWLADVAGKAGIAWERLFDAPEEKSLRTLRYELDLASSTIEKLEGRIRSCASPRRSVSRPSSTRRRSARWSASSTSCGAPAIRPRPGLHFSKGRPTPVPRLRLQRSLPTTLRACRTGQSTSSGSRASSKARCSASRMRAARGSSPSTSAGSPRSRRCGPRTAATPSRSTS